MYRSQPPPPPPPPPQDYLLRYYLHDTPSHPPPPMYIVLTSGHEYPSQNYSRRWEDTPGIRMNLIRLQLNHHN